MDTWETSKSCYWLHTRMILTEISIFLSSSLAVIFYLYEDEFIWLEPFLQLGPKFMSENGLKHVTFSTADGALEAAPAVSTTLFHRLYLAWAHHIIYWFFLLPLPSYFPFSDSFSVSFLFTLLLMRWQIGRLYCLGFSLSLLDTTLYILIWMAFYYLLPISCLF